MHVEVFLFRLNEKTEAQFFTEERHALDERLGEHAWISLEHAIFNPGIRVCV